MIDFFDASMSVQVGDGSHALFWMDHWLSSCSIYQLALDLRDAIPPRTRRSRMVQDTLQGKR
jgi:hypothetical protein